MKGCRVPGYRKGIAHQLKPVAAFVGVGYVGEDNLGFVGRLVAVQKRFYLVPGKGIGFSLVAFLPDNKAAGAF